MFDFSTMFGDTKSIVQGSTGREVPSFVGPVKPAAPKKSLWENIFSTATEVARTAGVKMPMEAELESLAAKRKELTSIKFRAQSISKTVADNLARRRESAASVAAAATLKKTCSQACAQADASIRLINAAISDGTMAVEKMKYGTGAFKPSATFFTKKAVADRVFSLAKNRLMLVISASEAKQNQNFAGESIPSRVNDARGNIVEFGGTVTRGIVKTGTAIKDATAPLASHAVPIAAAVAVGLYLISQRSND